MSEDTEMAPTPPSRGSRRLLKVGGILAALLMIAIAVTLSTNGGGEASLNPIAQAATITEESPGARFSIHGTVQPGSLPQPISVSGNGVLNSKAKRSQMTFTMFTPKGEVEMEAIGVGSEVYLQSSLFKSLPDGDEWVGYDTALGHSSEITGAAGSNPSEQLDLLQGVSDEFKSLGERTIRGVQTTGYRATLDIDHYVDYLRGKGDDEAAKDYERVAEVAPTTAEIETWIDDEKLVRQTRAITHTRDPSSGDTSSTTTTMDLYDFGLSPEVQPPDPSTVYDVTSKIRAQLGLNGSS
jgi:hypothetical protein